MLQMYKAFECIKENGALAMVHAENGNIIDCVSMQALSIHSKKMHLFKSFLWATLAVIDRTLLCYFIED